MGFSKARSIAVPAILLVSMASAAFAQMPDVDLSAPLTADQCVKLALERNYDVQLAGDAYGQAKAARLQAWGGLLPSVSGDWSYTHNNRQLIVKDFPFTGSDGVERRADFVQDPQKSDTRGYGVSVSQTLLSLPTLLNIVAQKRSANASEADIRSAEDQAALAVRQQYYTLIEAIKLLDVSQEDLRLATEEQKRTESLFDVGSVARTDVLKARVRVAEAQSALTSAENREQLERARLATALALPANAPLQVVESLDPRAEDVDSTAAYAEAERNRPDLAAARLRVGAAAAGTKAAYTAKLPYISHRYNYNNSTTPGDLNISQDPTMPDIRYLKYQSKSWSYSLGITWNIFDGLVTEGNVISAKSQQLSAEHRKEQLSLSVGLEVKEALLAVRASKSQIESAREGRASAEEDLKLSQERYSVGLGTILELIDAQVNLTRARTGEVQAMAALKRAEAQLDRAIGRRTW